MQVMMTMEEYKFLKAQEERLNELKKLSYNHKDHRRYDFLTDEYVNDKITIDKSVIKEILMKISDVRINKETEIIIEEN